MTVTASRSDTLTGAVHHSAGRHSAPRRHHTLGMGHQQLPRRSRTRITLPATTRSGGARTDHRGRDDRSPGRDRPAPRRGTDRRDAPCHAHRRQLPGVL